MNQFLLPLVFLVFFQCVHAEDFVRNLPSKGLVEMLTPEKIKNEDAVVILKEQSFKVDPFVQYQDETIHSPKTSYSKIIIAKLLTESAVVRYGSVEFAYPLWGDVEPRNTGFVRARVLKPDGTIFVMPTSDSKEIISRENGYGTPLEHKVIAKIPNLAIGDVVQIETNITIYYARDYSSIFYYNERDPVLFSNLYITLTMTEEPTFFSFPEQKVGNPQVHELADEFGSGKTYFWGLKNLNALHKEPLAPTFEDQSMITAFVVDREALSGLMIKADWPKLGNKFFKDYLNQDNVNSSKIKGLGFAANPSFVTMETVDSLYFAIRKGFILEESNSLYPLSKDINKLFEVKKGDASDCSYIFYNILLHQWKQYAQAVWIRDRRMGIYEQSVPTLHWFDRMGVLVTVGKKEKLYDFDRCAAEHYRMPWYLNGTTVVVIGEDRCEHKQIVADELSSTGLTHEQHVFHFNPDFTIQDSMTYSCTGSEAQHRRESLYNADRDQIHASMQAMAIKYCLQTVDTLAYNPLLQDETIVLSCKGRSKSKAELVDSFAVFKVLNHALQSFRDKIFSAARINHLMLDEPFTITAEWIIPIPGGYTLPSLRGEKTTSLKGGINGIIAQKRSGNDLHIRAEVSFPQTIIPVDQYPAVVKMLDGLIAELETDIILKKKK